MDNDRDSYGALLTEEHLNDTVGRTVTGFTADPGHDLEYHAAKALHSTLCPCLLADCIHCAGKHRPQISTIESALIAEIAHHARTAL